MVKKYHPDINKSKEANQIIVSLNEAKEILLNEEKKKEYDALLEGIEHSKQFSKDKEESYYSKSQVYREKYAESYVTRWQYLMNYLKNGVDNILWKIIKLLLVILNYLLFFSIKGIIFITVILVSLFGGLIDYLAGFIMLLGVIGLFVLMGDAEPNYLPWIPANIEIFLMLGIVASLMEIAKIAIINGSTNLLVLTQNIQDKIFVKILMK